MLNTLAFVLALQLVPARAGELTITNVRGLYGPLGPARTSDKLIPGDFYFVGFTTEGMKVAPNGRVVYSMSMELQDSNGKVISKQAPRELQTLQSLGGSEVQMYAAVTVGADQPPGNYSMKLTIQDVLGKKTGTLTQKFEIVKPRFAIIRLRPTLDQNGIVPAPTVGVPGQNVFVEFWVVGFERGADKQPNVSAQILVTDEDGKATITKPEVLRAPQPGQPLEADKDVIPMSLPLALNRTGKFKVRLRVVDEVSKKHYEISYPITVVPNK